MKRKTTYGVYNLIEWQAILRMGRAVVRIPFTGGSITTQGVTPATYTTSDPIIQYAIERSPEYHSGKIKMIRRVLLGGEIEIERNAPRSIFKDVDSGSESCCKGFPSVKDTDVKTDNPADAGQLPPLTDRLREVGAEESAGGDETVGLETGLTEVAVSCLPEAQNYLRDHFGIATSKSRSKERAQALARENNIVFVGL